eukprot:14165-Heterococcus_DN1.PRE.5
MSALGDTVSYYRCLIYFMAGGSYAACPHFKDNQQAKVQVYSLSLIFYLWNKPHYRNGTFQDDMVKNLRNVAIPGTGVPLSLMCILK